jgi:hypothetical protein
VTLSSTASRVVGTEWFSSGQGRACRSSGQLRLRVN